MIKNKKIPRLFYVFFLSIALPFSFSNIPQYNWDIVGYTAAGYSLNGLENEILHKTTFEDIEKGVPEVAFKSLTEKSLYKKKVYSEHESLNQQLPFYKIRIAYVFLVMIFGEIIGSLSKATILISIISGFLIILTTSLNCINIKNTYIFLLIPLIVGIIIKDVSRYSTPDALAGLIALWGLLTLNHRIKVVPIFLISFLVFFRTDFIIFSLIISLYFFLKKKRLESILILFQSIVFYSFIKFYIDSYSYLTIFNFTLINGPDPYPKEMMISYDYIDYIKAYLIGIFRIVGNKVFWIILFSLFFIIKEREGFFRNNLFHLYLIAISFFCVHFILFPSGFERFYFLVNIIVFLFLLRFVDYDKKIET